MNNEKGFTLIEMLIVLFIISILLLITIPNVSIQKKGCEGLQNMVKAQITAFELDHDGKTPSLGDLQSEGYVKKNVTCPNGKQIIVTGGEVKVEN
ncbi:competence type IV pilus major pilin ComGC [Bacillus atrophaeus]|uniref:competence type IV pilus major pilin ComGC n=1 Tax=Bacillus atrophaeus TaxID=1452 RepID=UPI00399D47FE